MVPISVQITAERTGPQPGMVLQILIFALLLYFCIALLDHFLEHGNARDFKSHTQSDIRILEFSENVGVETIVGLHVRLTALKKIGHAHIYAQLIAIQVDELDFQACAVLNHRHTIPHRSRSARLE